MEGKWKTPARARAIALVALGLVIGTTMMATPAVAHVGGTVTHLVGHLKKTFFTKAQSNARYADAVAGTDKAKDADRLDGLDSSAIRVTSHGAGASHVNISSCGAQALVSYPIELAHAARIYVDGVSGAQSRGDAGHDPSIQVQLLTSTGAVVATSARAIQHNQGNALSVGGMLLNSNTPYVAPAGSYTLRLFGSTFGPCTSQVQYQDLRLSHMVFSEG